MAAATLPLSPIGRGRHSLREGGESSCSFLLKTLAQNPLGRAALKKKGKDLPLPVDIREVAYPLPLFLFLGASERRKRKAQAKDTPC